MCFRVLYSCSRRTDLITQAHRQSAIRGLGARHEVPCSRNTADELRGHVPPTTSVRGAGVGPTKVLSEKPLCRSLSSIHILYNQAIVGEMGPLLASARQIDNVSLPGGSTLLVPEHAPDGTGLLRMPRGGASAQWASTISLSYNCLSIV